MSGHTTDRTYLEDELRQEGPMEAVKQDFRTAKEAASRSGPDGEPAARERTLRTAGLQAYLMLRVVFTVAPILFGVDKFFNFMVDWDKYLAPWIEGLVPVDATTFMLGVGAVEIIGGLLVALVPRIGAPIVALWLLAIVVNLATYDPPQYYDIALRDVGLMAGALTLTRLAWGVARAR